jgi:chromosome segregation ATPase
LTRKY